MAGGSWHGLSGDLIAEVLHRGFRGRPPLVLRAASSVECRAVTLLRTNVTALSIPFGENGLEADCVRKRLQAASTAICRTVCKLRRLSCLDLRRFAGFRLIPTWPIFPILHALPESTAEVYLPRIAFESAHEVTKLRRLMRNVATWSCQAGRQVENEEDESTAMLLQGAVLLASPGMAPPFNRAVIMLLGYVGPQEWFGVMVNGHVMEGDTFKGRVRQGGPLRLETGCELWAVALDAETDHDTVICGDERQLAAIGTLIGMEGPGRCAGEGWRAWQEALPGSAGVHLFFGESAWGSGQLDDEIACGDWKIVFCPARMLLEDISAELLYDTLSAAIAP
eukprot:TRINITY_DN51746_c0_g1_i1.p1 TRINITY_DN51746_c0_g1~~TRINITY_DN51746_c0_g1_i1.p1  ORF type:complete len:337 (-),score=65.01 TRINITY_DN51746_c0_g1_i1:127-1137(-)